MARNRTACEIVFNNFPVLQEQLPKGAARVVQQTVYDIDTLIFVMMHGAKHGRQYGRHKASAPGEAPAVDTGMLVNSLEQDFDFSPTRAVGYEYTAVEYAPYLEFGTVKMRPRPFMVPAAEAHRQAFIMAMRELLDRAGK